MASPAPTSVTPESQTRIRMSSYPFASRSDFAPTTEASCEAINFREVITARTSRSFDAIWRARNANSAALVPMTHS